MLNPAFPWINPTFLLCAACASPPGHLPDVLAACRALPWNPLTEAGIYPVDKFRGKSYDVQKCHRLIMIISIYFFLRIIGVDPYLLDIFIQRMTSLFMQP